MAQLFQVARELLSLLHHAAGFSQARFLARLWFQRGQFAQMGEQQILIRLRLVHRLTRSQQAILRLSPCGPCRCQPFCVGPGIAVQQHPVSARIDQPAIIMLAMQLHQCRRERAQQPSTHRLIVDEGLGTSVRLDLSPDHQRFARLNLYVGIVQRLGNQRRQSGELKACGDARLRLSCADQRCFRPVAQHQPQRVEQDRLARACLPRQHAQPAPERQLERFDQHDIADGQAGQHRPIGSSPTDGLRHLGPDTNEQF